MGTGAFMNATNDTKKRPDLSGVIEKRRVELSQRPDVSARMRTLSESSGRNPIIPPRARRSPLLGILLAVAGMAALLACAVSASAVIASGVWFQDQINSPSTTAEDYFAAIHQQDYPRAYSFFSTAAKRQTSENDYTSRSRTIDILQGGVVSYSVDSKTTTSTTATVVVDVVRSGSPNKAQVETLTLVNENGSWRIDAIVQSGGEPASTSGS